MKIKKNTGGLGKFIYMEWLLPIIDYYISLRFNETIYEVVLPIIVSIATVGTYIAWGSVETALSGLASMLPSAISILIGFTAMLITILLTSNGESVKRLKEYMTETEVHGKKVSLFQKLHIQLSHSLFSEIILLLCIFFRQFIYGIIHIKWLNICILFVEVFLTLNILLSILRGITNIYFSFYTQKKE